MFRFRGRWSGAALVALASGLLIAMACTPQAMTDQPRLDTYAESGFFADRASARPLISDTVARGTVQDDEHLYTGKSGTTFVNTFPEPVTAETLKRGQDKYNVFCTPCHGYRGYGGGRVAARGFQGVRGLHDDRLRNVEVGYLYDVISNGLNQMPPYGHLIAPEDRWAVIAYIRALQLSQNARIDDVPADERAQLEAGG